MATYSVRLFLGGFASIIERKPGSKPFPDSCGCGSPILCSPEKLAFGNLLGKEGGKGGRLKNLAGCGWAMGRAWIARLLRQAKAIGILADTNPLSSASGCSAAPTMRTP